MFRREERKKKEEKRIGQTKLKNLISKVFKKKKEKKVAKQSSFHRAQLDRIVSQT